MSDEELRAEVKQILRDGFNYYIGERKDTSSDMKPLDTYCTEHLMQLIKQHREAYANEATDNIILMCLNCSRMCTVLEAELRDSNTGMCGACGADSLYAHYQSIAEFREKVGRDEQPE